jgi:hypothetical protein
LAVCVAFACVFTGWASAQPEPWVHPDGTIHYYHAVAMPGGINWSAAFDSARARGGYLATFTSRAEDSLAFRLIDSSGYWYARPGSGKLAGPWLGGFQPAGAVEPGDGWQWMTGEPFAFPNWSPGEPDNQDGNENALNFGESVGVRVPTWNDLSDGDSALPGYVLELSADTTTVGLIQVSADTSPGYTLFDPCPSDLNTYLIDNKGRLVHKWHSSYRTSSSVYLLENGNLLRCDNLFPPVFQMGGRVEILDWNSNVVWGYTYSTSTYCAHHDAIMLPNGHVLITAWELKSRDSAIAAGRDSARVGSGGVWPDHLIEVDPANDSIIWEWHAWDHLIQDFDSTKANYGPVGQHSELVDINYGSTQADWIHVNALDYKEEFDQILMGPNSFYEVWVIDHSTTTAEARGHTGGRYGMGGDLLYRWGNPRAYRAGDSTNRWFYLTHNAQWIREGLPGAGNMLVYNNGMNRPGGNSSSVDEFIPPVDSSGHYTRPAPGTPFGPAAPCWVYGGTPPGSFYSGPVSGCQRMPNGNTLVCEGERGHAFEVRHDSTFVWDYISPMVGVTPKYQGDTFPTRPAPWNNTIFRATRYFADYPGLAGRDLTPTFPIEQYRPPAMPAPVPRAPVNHSITRTPTPLLRVGTIPKFNCDSVHFRLFVHGDTTPIQEQTSSGDSWTVAALPIGQYEWDCQAHNADGWSTYFTPKWSFTAVIAPSGWSPNQPLPSGTAGTSIKDGGWLAYDASQGLIYAAKGNKTSEFYAYDLVKDSWSTRASWPNGTEAKPPKAGAVGRSDGNGVIYAVKGNNTRGFFKYDAAKDSWQQLGDVPLGNSNKKVKGGTDLACVHKDGADYVYLLKGHRQDFLRYDVAAASWQSMPDAPAGSSPKYDKGSFLVYDGTNLLYAHKAKYHELYAFNVATGTWGAALRGMPFLNKMGKSKKSKDGGAGVWLDGAIYALKGGNTQEFWKYTVARDSWAEQETIPQMAPGGLKKKKVKAGAGITNAGGLLYATKGNKSLEFWRYGLPLLLDSRPAGNGSVMSGSEHGGLQFAFRVAPNPFTGATTVSYSVPRAGVISLKLYDVTGSLVTALAEGRVNAGNHMAHIDASRLAHGVYVLRFESGEYRAAKKLILE